MECDALFAESDDEVEVLPPSIEGVRGETARGQPVSSSYADSAAAHLYDLNAPLAHPGSARTPVPEEYQPLPDSSSHLDYMLTGDGQHGGHRRPDVNIRYQPKQNSYYYPSYSHYPPGMQPLPEYLVSQYRMNNMMLPHDDRNYMVHPLYSNADPQLVQEQPPPRYGHSVPSAAHIPQPYHAGPPSNLPASLERPSRKLNITPRRQQSKETDVNPNPIEVSSEEEDNNTNSRKRQYDNGANHRVKDEVNMEGPSSSSSNRASAALPRIDIKREPHDHSDIATQAAGDADVSRNTQPNTRQNAPMPSISVANPHVHCVQSSPVQVKQENSSCTHNHGHSCSTRMNHMHNSCGHYRDCRRHSPSHFNCANASLYHHHHRPVVPCVHNRGTSIPESSSLPIPRIKEEPETQPIKQEAGSSQSVQASEEEVQSTSIKSERTQACVKTEPAPSISNIDEERSSEEIENLVVKHEDRRASRMSCEIDAAGDRVPVSSPQPGPSVERVPVPSDGITNNCCNQASQPLSF